MMELSCIRYVYSIVRYYIALCLLQGVFHDIVDK